MMNVPVGFFVHRFITLLLRAKAEKNQPMEMQHFMM